MIGAPSRHRVNWSSTRHAACGTPEPKHGPKKCHKAFTGETTSDTPHGYCGLKPAAMDAQLEMGHVGLAAVKLASAVDEQTYIGFETALTAPRDCRSWAEHSRTGYRSADLHMLACSATLG